MLLRASAMLGGGPPKSSSTVTINAWLTSVDGSGAADALAVALVGGVVAGGDGDLRFNE